VTPHIFIFTALPSEAKGLIADLNLKRWQGSQVYGLFVNATYCLTVTGMGKAAMAAGMGYTFGTFPKVVNPVIVNVGIAGHDHLALGTVLAAQKIIDMDTRRCFYPQLVGSVPLQTEIIATVSTPETAYQQPYVYEMEAAAFYETALSFSTAELVQVVKVISDNSASSVEKITPQWVTALMIPALGSIRAMIDELSALRGRLPAGEPVDYQRVTEQWKFTVSQKSQLKKLLWRFQVLSDQSLPEDFETGSFLLRWLEQEVDQLAVKTTLM
jgi:predicted DNA-binding transcriptional regulator AlpA